MDKPTYHIMLCASFRVGGEPKGACHKKGSTGLLQFIEEEVLDRGMDALITATGCMKQCERGPVMVVQPHDQWYGGVDSEEAIEAILDGLEDGEPCEEYLL